MNQLAVQNKIEQLPQVQREFVGLRVGNKAVKDLAESVVKRACADILSKAIFDSLQGQGKTEAESRQILAFQTEALFSELKGQFSNLTIPEIQEAFRRGVRGESGQWFGMCPKTYHQFLKWFYNLPERQKSWVDYLALTEPVNEPSGMDKLMFSKNACQKAFAAYRDHRMTPSSGWAYYEIINELIGVDYNGVKTLITDREARKRIVTEITSKHKADLKQEQEKAQKRGRKATADAIQSILDNNFKNTKSLENLIKEAFLKHYFDELISKKQELTL